MGRRRDQVRRRRLPGRADQLPDHWLGRLAYLEDFPEARGGDPDEGLRLLSNVHQCRGDPLSELYEPADARVKLTLPGVAERGADLGQEGLACERLLEVWCPVGRCLIREHLLPLVPGHEEDSQ